MVQGSNHLKSKNFDKNVTQIRVSQIRASQIRASQIRATEVSSNHRELHGAMLLLSQDIFEDFRRRGQKCFKRTPNFSFYLCVEKLSLMRQETIWDFSQRNEKIFFLETAQQTPKTNLHPTILSLCATLRCAESMRSNWQPLLHGQVFSREITILADDFHFSTCFRMWFCFSYICDCGFHTLPLHSVSTLIGQFEQAANPWRKARADDLDYFLFLLDFEHCLVSNFDYNEENMEWWCTSKHIWCEQWSRIWNNLDLWPSCGSVSHIIAHSLNDLGIVVMSSVSFGVVHYSDGQKSIKAHLKLCVSSNTLIFLRLQFPDSCMKCKFTDLFWKSWDLDRDWFYLGSSNLFFQVIVE